MTIFISDNALNKMGEYKKAGMTMSQICGKLRSDGFPESEVLSVEALLTGRLKKRREVITQTVRQ